jgi:hypothetical protein
VLPSSSRRVVDITATIKHVVSWKTKCGRQWLHLFALKQTQKTYVMHCAKT